MKAYSRSHPHILMAASDLALFTIRHVHRAFAATSWPADHATHAHHHAVHARGAVRRRALPRLRSASWYARADERGFGAGEQHTHTVGAARASRGADSLAPRKRRRQAPNAACSYAVWPSPLRHASAWRNALPAIYLASRLITCLFAHRLLAITA